MMIKAKFKYLAVWYSRKTNNILHRIPPPLLEFTSVKLVCDHFLKYFVVDKIETIRIKFPDKVPNISSVQKPVIKSKMIFLMGDRR